MYPNDHYFGHEQDSYPLDRMEVDQVNEQELREMEQMLGPHMQQYVVQAPVQSETDALLTRLRPHFQRRLGNVDDILFHKEAISEDPFVSLHSQQTGKYSFIRLITLQYHIYSKAFMFFITGLFAFITTVVCLPHIQFVKGEQMLSFSIPLLVIAGVIYGCRSSHNKLSQLQEISPYPPVLQFIARVFLVCSVCLILGVISSVVIFVFQDQFRTLSFLWSWIAPTALLSGFMVYVMQKRGIVPGIATSIAVWVCYMMLTQSTWLKYIPLLSKSLGVIAFLVGSILLILSIIKLNHHPVVRSWRIDEI